MPERIVCGECGVVLYEGEEIRAPYEVAAGYEGRCPGCARKLSQTPRSIEIRSLNPAQ